MQKASLAILPRPSSPLSGNQISDLGGYFGGQGRVAERNKSEGGWGEGAVLAYRAFQHVGSTTVDGLKL